MFRVLGKDEPEATEIVRQRLVDEGIEMHEGIAIKNIARQGNGILVTIEKDGQEIGHRRLLTCWLPPDGSRMSRA